MTREPDAFRRVLLDLAETGDGEGGVRAAAELARLLGVDLLGVFVADEAVLGLADLPLARELRLPGYEWSRIDAARIAAEFEGAARRARRLLEEQCARLGVSAAFEFLRGDPAAALGALARAGDIVALPGARAPAGRASGEPLPRALEAALRSAASVMLLPQRIARHAGPVAAVAATPSDPGLRAAAGIAAAARERLLVLRPPGAAGFEEAVAAATRAARLPEGRVLARGLRELSADAILEALEGARERLLVLGRGAAGAARLLPPPLVSARGVPALLVGPPEESPAAEDRKG
ncbi:hypothetical protein [Caldovatus aquaticus]|uniref:UspA domain-containing protein n=1 Tax=Caldovatus aquaticus TaxID=2865671 RepID=A0ABS7F382_9PROT|nr:hypothetical protein [Caldovatus aquaticus]MBW8269286.1 hypothetical protein [Caldovatus aquaticus]